MTAFISFGSNEGDRLAHLTDAKRRLAGTLQITLLAVSPVYEAEPVGCKPGTRPFYNAAVALETELTPHLLLDALQQIEVAMGRPPTRPKNVPRAIDLDLLLCGDAVIRDARLTLPHPLLFTRRFVLQPLADLDPDFEVPTIGKPVSELLQTVSESHWIRKVASQW
jgi:2-amino-4-hydroxy-6-hydroxymethyldihydropteridine diphosphokinase